MSLSTAEETIVLPEETDVEEVKNSLLLTLKDSDEIKTVSHERTPAGYVVTADTEATWRSWGEKIEIEITPTKIEVRSDSTEQLFDWGKSDKTVGEITARMRDLLDNEDLPTV